MQNIKLKVLIEGAISIALSVALSFVKLFSMPQGGSVSLAMLPLVIFALRRGGSLGMTAGMVTGVLRLFMGAYIVHPVQALLDYPIAYAAIGIAGFFSDKKFIGIPLAFAANLAASVLSGVIFFASYAPKGTNVWLYSTVYNASSVVPEAAICLILVYFIWPRLAKSS